MKIWNAKPLHYMGGCCCFLVLVLSLYRALVVVVLFVLSELIP